MKFIDRVRSGGLLSQSSEWEVRARSERLRHGDVVPTMQRITGLSSENVGDSMLYPTGSNIEVIAEVLMSAPSDANEIDWARMELPYAEAMAT